MEVTENNGVGGYGAESGYSRNVLSVERLFLLLMLRSHALSALLDYFAKA